MNVTLGNLNRQSLENSFNAADVSGVKELPAIGLFRNGQFVQYEGDETSEKQIHAWLTDEETLKIIGVIDEVIDCSFCVL